MSPLKRGLQSKVVHYICAKTLEWVKNKLFESSNEIFVLMVECYLFKMWMWAERKARSEVLP